MNKGFTVVELISVIAILGLLVIIVTPTYGSISDNIRKKSYDSRKNEIKNLTLSFVEKYAKDKVYNGTNSTICFSPEFLIRNGIITSDDEKEEYIENEYTRINYTGRVPYIKIEYDNTKYKMRAITVDEVSDLGCTSYKDEEVFE